MDFYQFFNINPSRVGLMLGIIAFVIVAFAALIAWKYDVVRKMRESGLSYYALIPILGRRSRANTAYEELQKAKQGIQYAPESVPLEERRKRFMEFIQGSPIYCIDSDFFSSLIRNTLGGGGANYQQVVLHDSSSLDDVCIWVRKEGNYFLHNKGIYLFPWDLQKTILHWDVQDCRPMEDKSPQALWPDSKMNARYFWGIVNSIAMNKDDEEMSKTQLIMLAAVVLTFLISLYIAYSIGKYNDAQIELLKTIAENTKRV